MGAAYRVRMDDQFRRFRDRVVWGPFSEVSPKDIERVESKIGAGLHDGYRRFIDQCHGGTVDYSIDLPPGVGGDVVSFSDWFHLTPENGEEGFGSVLGELRHLDDAYFASYLPPDLLPIARDGMGSMLFIRVGSVDRGGLYAFVHGTPDWAAGSNQDSGGPVAGSLDEYFDLLYIEDEIGESVWADRTPAYEESIAVWLDSGCPGWRDRPWATKAANG